MQAGPDVLPKAEGGEGTPSLLLLHPHCCSLGLPLATLRWKLGEEAEIQLAWVSRCKSEQGKGVEGAQEKEAKDRQVKSSPFVTGHLCSASHAVSATVQREKQQRDARAHAHVQACTHTFLP